MENSGDHCGAEKRPAAEAHSFFGPAVAGVEIQKRGQHVGAGAFGHFDQGADLLWFGDGVAIHKKQIVATGVRGGSVTHVVGVTRPPADHTQSLLARGRICALKHGLAVAATAGDGHDDLEVAPGLRLQRGQ